MTCPLASAGRVINGVVDAVSHGQKTIPTAIRVEKVNEKIIYGKSRAFNGFVWHENAPECNESVSADSVEEGNEFESVEPVPLKEEEDSVNEIKEDQRRIAKETKKKPVWDAVPRAMDLGVPPGKPCGDTEKEHGKDSGEEGDADDATYTPETAALFYTWINADRSSAEYATLDQKVRNGYSEAIFEKWLQDYEAGLYVPRDIKKTK